jgi:uncharacterized damage-inducible protein DinB
MNDLRYPVGKFSMPDRVSSDLRREWIAVIAGAPGLFRDAVAGLSDSQLDTPYREGGWTVRQVVHHVADSHMNCYTRFRLALTEAEPTIRPYEEALWAELPDAKGAPVGISLALLDALHERWVLLLNAMVPEDWDRQFVHPETGPTTLDRALGLYAWHSRHHAGHITALRERLGW